MNPIKIIFLIVFFVFLLNTNEAQELYVFSNPASNIPARAIMGRGAVKMLQSYRSLQTEYRYLTEWQAGISHQWMISGGVSFSDMYFQNKMRGESARLYTKYRFYSQDEVQRHFRMAAFMGASWSRNDLVYQELSLEGDNSAIQCGLTATQLLHKLALSGTVSFIQLTGNPDKINFGLPFNRSMWQSSFSAGYLVLPFRYTSFQQVNLNLYAEFLAQYAPEVKKGFVDVAPALQLIFNSRTRLNAGARFQLAGGMHRMAPRSWMLSVERIFLNSRR